MSSGVSVREAAHLCLHIVREHFGSVVERVVKVLLRYGRLTVPELVRLLNDPPPERHHPGRSRSRGSSSKTEASPNSIPTRLVQQALMVLIQHHCVLHSRPSSGVAAGANQEHFEVDMDEVFSRLRFGSYLDLAQKWGGDDAQAVIRLLLYHGQMRAADLIDALVNETPRGAEDTDDYTKKKRALRTATLSELLARMLQSSLVRPSTAVQHVSPQDRRIALEESLLRSQKGIPTAKSLRELKAKVASILDEEDRRDWEGVEHGEDGLRLGLKRKEAKDGSREKRARRSTHADVSAGRMDVIIDPDVWLRVHNDYFHIQMRNDMIATAVGNKYNSTTGDVMRLMLQQDQPGVCRCEKDERSRPISVTTLSHHIPEHVRIQRGLDRRSIMGDERTSRAPTTIELLAEYVSILSAHDNISSSARKTRLLAPFGSSSTTSAGGSARVATSFTVEYRNILEQMQLQLIRDVVVERFGAMAGRIFSILVEKGKLEEKHISKIGLLSMSETRDICSRMFAASILSLQEVPKSNERNPQRTFFLWFVDLYKCKSWLLDQLYRTLIQLSRRRLYEEANKSSLLEKSERTDVREDAESLLTEWERNELQSLRSVQAAITVAEARVVQDIFILQHFST
ncbi:RNA polymerase III subunit C82 [Malassezia pachydermatis]